jgi:hypothetical protein
VISPIRKKDSDLYKDRPSGAYGAGLLHLWISGVNRADNRQYKLNKAVLDDLCLIGKRYGMAIKWFVPVAVIHVGPVLPHRGKCRPHLDDSLTRLSSQFDEMP